MMQAALKISWTIRALALVLIFIFMLVYPETSGYEVNIFEAYPKALWVALFSVLASSLGIGLFLFLFRGHIRNLKKEVALVVTSNLLILLLPYIRNYVFVEQWDLLEHYGRARYIQDTAATYADNFYPFIHIFLTILADVTNVELQTLLLLFPIGVYLWYLLNIGFLAHVVFRSNWIRLTCVLLATPLIFGTYSTTVRPTHLAVCALPLIIGLLIRSRLGRRQVAYTVAFILFLLCLPFLHPWAVLVSLAIFASYLGFSSLFSWSSISNGGWQKPSKFLSPLLILLVIWSTWFSSFSVFDIALERVVEAFLEALGPDNSFEHYLAAAGRANLSIAEVGSLIFFKYGAQILYFLLPIAAYLYFLKKRFRSARSGLKVWPMVPVAVLFVVLSGLSLFVDIFTQNPIRLLNFATVCIPILTGAALVRWHEMMNRGMKISVALVGTALLSGAAVIGALSSYNTPLIGEANLMVSKSQMLGHHFLANRAPENQRNSYSPFGGAKTVYTAYNYGEVKALRAYDFTWRTKVAPAHFGYAPDYLDIQFVDAGYLWLTAHERAYYSAVWPEGGRFTKDDFFALASDPTWHHVYSSQDYDLWSAAEGTKGFQLSRLSSVY